MSGCLSPLQQGVLYYNSIPETIVLFITFYGLISWMRTKKLFGFLGPVKKEESKPREAPPSELTNETYLPPPTLEEVK